MNTTQEIKKQLTILAIMFGRELNELVLDGYMAAISDLPPEGVLVVLTTWMKKSKTFPLPADIREKVLPAMSPDEDAEIAANLIIGAVEACGYTNPKQARERIGELGWAVVQASGGWQHLCSALTYDNETSFRAQLKNLAKAVYRKALRGELDQAPELPVIEKIGEQREKIRLIAGGVFK